MCWEVWESVLGGVGECVRRCGRVCWESVGECVGRCGRVWESVLGECGRVCWEVWDVWESVLGGVGECVMCVYTNTWEEGEVCESMTAGDGLTQI